MQVYGAAGASLTDSHFKDTAAVGARAERKTAELLARVLRGTNATVLHDLRIPGSNANIDHVIVSGKHVTLLDTKQWRAGFYWTVGGVTRRGLTRFPPGDKRTLPFAVSRLRPVVPGAKFDTPLFVVHGGASLWAYRAPGARAIHPEGLRRSLARHGAADARIVRDLHRHLY